MSQTVRPLEAVAVLAAVAAATAGVVASPSASALPPIKRVVDDPVEPGKAYDIVQVVLRGAPEPGKKAVVVVKHGRQVKFGDSIDLWFNLDDDPDPDVHLVGDSFSEYVVFKTSSFTEDGKDISGKGCFSLSMAGKRSKVKFDPDCLGPSLKFAVSVKTHRFNRPGRADWAPRTTKFTKKVLSAPLA